MARADGTETSGDGGAVGGAGGSPEVVDIGSHVQAAVADADTRSDTGSKRIRRTRAELEAAGYYEGKDTGKPAAAKARPNLAKGGSLDVNSVQFALTGIHSLLAVGFGAAELELSETEAETVSKNIVAVARHYDLQQTAKATDWGNLVVSLGVVYGGRLIRISARTSAEKKARRGATAPNTGFVPTAPNVAPQQPQTAAPTVNAKMGVETRQKRAEDDLFLNEVEPFLAP